MSFLLRKVGSQRRAAHPDRGQQYHEHHPLSFLNTPSTSGVWMLQFGGHHYGANIAYNQGHVVGTTPQFEALEPLSFTSNGTTYTPLAQERDALATMLASLNSTQLASAKLSTMLTWLVVHPC